jgi:hypothetical protein
MVWSLDGCESVGDDEFGVLVNSKVDSKGQYFGLLAFLWRGAVKH